MCQPSPSNASSAPDGADAAGDGRDSGRGIGSFDQTARSTLIVSVPLPVEHQDNPRSPIACAGFAGFILLLDGPHAPFRWLFAAGLGVSARLRLSKTHDHRRAEVAAPRATSCTSRD